MKEKLIKESINNKAFTLIELLIVVLIIGILAAIALPQYQLARDKAKFSTMMELANALMFANQRYYLANGSYTGDVTVLDIDLPGSSILTGNKYYYFDWGGQCGLTNSNGNGGCLMYFSEGTDNVQYQFSTTSQSKRCMASNSRGHRLCGAMTGNTAGGVSGIWTWYAFQ